MANINIINFPHSELELFNYAYIPTYRKYYSAYTWCRTNTKKLWNVDGDPDTQLYRFAFIDDREYTMFLLKHSDLVIHTRHSKDYTNNTDTNHIHT